MHSRIFLALILALLSECALAQSPPFIPRKPYSPVPQATDETKAPPPVAIVGWPPVGWSPTAYEGFVRAKEADKPLVVLFEEKDCQWCSRLQGVILSDPRFVELQARVVFAVVDMSSQDDVKANNQKMVTDLGIERVPTLAVLEVNSDVIKERTRIVGFLPPDQLISRLEAFIK